MGNLGQFSLFIPLVLLSASVHAEQQTGPQSHAASIDNHQGLTAPNGEYELLLDAGFDSKYISEGRNNLESGGIAWTTASLHKNGLTAYATMGRGTDQHYIEWNFGLEYGFNLSENIEASLGYQRLEFYGNERDQDNELFSTFVYTGVEWLAPSISYTYSSEANGYFVEASLHGHWNINNSFSISPYVTQAFDFKYATKEHDGANHIQFGVESEYLLADSITVAVHVSHSVAQNDIKRENSDSSDLDQTFLGGHITWVF